jgi:hypothetical protein
MMRVNYKETETEVIETFVCTNKMCARFSGFDLNNPKYSQEVRKSK